MLTFYVANTYRWGESVKGTRIVDVNYLKAPKLVRDYLDKSTKIADFFQYPDYRIEQILSNCTLEKAKTLSPEFISSLLKYNENLDCSPQVKDNIKKLADKDCKVIITGQQAGLLTGAAFVIYKAASAIIIAKELENQLKKPVVPMFWIASEDHDFLEVNSCNFYLDNKLIKKGIIKPVPGMPPVGEIPVPAQVQEIIDELLIKTESNEGRKLLTEMKEQAATANNMAELFGVTFSSLFGSYGLIMLDSMLPALRIEAAPLVRKVFSQWELLLENIRKTGRQLTQLGYTPAFSTTETNQFPMFYHLNNQREPIYINSLDRVEIGKNKPLVMTFKQLRENYEQQPQSFSPNAFLRPLIQDFIFSTAAYVAGPGEINYFAQLKDIYRLLGVRMPVIFPRARVTLINQQQWQYLEELDVAFPLDYSRILELQKDQLVILDTDRTFAKIEEQMKKIEKAHSKIAKLIGDNEPSLKILGEQNWNRVNYQLKYLYSKAWQKHKRKHRVAIAKLDQLYDFLHPLHNEQEMVLNIISLVTFLDNSIIPHLLTRSLIENPEYHKLLVLGGN